MCCKGSSSQYFAVEVMASPSSEPGNESVLHGTTKLNKAVFQLHAPPLTENQIVDVVFFHGLQVGDYKNAYWKTWLVSNNDSILWPKDWLGSSLPRARILSVSYDSSARQVARRERPDDYIITENLLNDLLKVAEVGQKCPVILVGHSLGGLIIKLVILRCLAMKGISEGTKEATEDSDCSANRYDNFLRNCRGVFYYSTPHLGSVTANAVDVGSRIGEFLLRTDPASLNAPLMKLLKILCDATARINSDFANARNRLGLKGIRTSAVGEGLKTNCFGLSLKVVEEASARFDLNAGFYTASDSDHFEVCRPEIKTDPIYLNLLSFIKDAVPSSGAETGPREGPNRDRVIADKRIKRFGNNSGKTIHTLSEFTGNSNR